MTTDRDASLVGALEKRFQERRDALFLDVPTGGSVTFGEAWDQSARYANVFAAHGVTSGERVLFKIDKSVEFIFAYLACLRAGIIFLPINPAFTRHETAHILEDARPALIVAEHRDLESFDSDILSGGRFMSIEAAVKETSRQSSAFGATYRVSDTPAVILYTSGTTGRPKGATLSHGNIHANGMALIDAWDFAESDVLLHALPLFHSHGLFVSLSCSLLTASRVILLEKFDLDLVISLLPQATVFMGVPTMYVRLAADPRLTETQTRGVRLFASGSSALSPKTFHLFKQRTGREIVERFGMSETAINTSNPLRGEKRVGTVGKPLDGVEVEIRNIDGNTEPPGTPGAIHVHGPHVFLGYWAKPEQTRSVKSDDGWFDTGDIGFVDADGYLTLVGRSKDVIITGGYNAYPAEIELVLDRLPGMVETSVVGLPHQEYGEAVTAIAVAEQDTKLTAASVRELAKRQLAGYKVPKAIVFVDELPRNHLGKVDKRMLRDRFWHLYDNDDAYRRAEHPE